MANIKYKINGNELIGKNEVLKGINQQLMTFVITAPKMFLVKQKITECFNEKD